MNRSRRSAIRATITRAGCWRIICSTCAPLTRCYNRIGYYEVPNSRLVYRAGGQVRSLGIASMIAWRGTWYVVHLGAVTRTGEDGVVDDPSDGPGTPEPSLTC